MDVWFSEQNERDHITQRPETKNELRISFGKEFLKHILLYSEMLIYSLKLLRIFNSKLQPLCKISSLTHDRIY